MKKNIYTDLGNVNLVKMGVIGLCVIIFAAVGATFFLKYSSYSFADYVYKKEDLEIKDIDDTQEEEQREVKLLLVDEIQLEKFIDAIKENNLAKLYEHKKTVTDLNQYNKEGTTALIVAAGIGNIEMAKLICEWGADIDLAENEINNNGNTPLIAALKNSHDATAVYFLEHGANSNISDIDKNYPIHFAAQNGCLESIKQFIKKRADINRLDKNNLSPLALAIINGHQTVGKYLIKYGADLNMSYTQNGSEEQMSTIELALYNSQDEVVSYLINNGQKISKDSKYLFKAIDDKNANLVALLLSNGVDTKSYNKDDLTPFRYALSKNSLDVIKQFILNGENVNEDFKDGTTPLIIAITNGNIELAKFLIESGAKINKKDSNDKTALDYAIELDNKDIINLLAPSEEELN